MTVSIYNSRRPLTFMSSVANITCVTGLVDRTAYNTVQFSGERKEHHILFSAKSPKQGGKSHYISSVI